MGIPPDSNRHLPTHPSDNILEEYAFNRLPEALAAPVEEHLLVCHTCQDALSEADQFSVAMKGWASQPVPRPVSQLAQWKSVLPRLGNTMRLAPIFALLILAFGLVWKHPQEASTPVAVSLSSLRGASPLAPAPAGTPLRLSIDLPDLVSGREYRAEVVDATGSPIWTGAVSKVDGKLTATLSKPLRNGLYWVRLYGADSELLREFGLSAK